MTKRRKIILIDDDELILSMLSRVLNKEGYDVTALSESTNAVDKIKTGSPDIVLLDINLPDKNGIEILQEVSGNGTRAQFIMLTADDTAETAVKAMKLGAVDYLTKPFNTDEVKIVIHNALEKEKLREEVDYLRKVYSETYQSDLLGESLAIDHLKQDMKKMAQARVPSILITGESGTGKEVVARNIHKMMYSNNESGYAPFVSINCAALPESILESELFGYKKGSFTDAKTDRKGLFEMAHGGTILLDEIGEMKHSLQSKLLRVLEERTVRRLGGEEEIPVDINVLATTNRNMADAVKEGEFRNDLFFRLNTFYLHILPLRERREDIPVLARHFLSNFSTKYNKRVIRDFSPESDQLLMSHNWPGNVRELRNLIERFVVLENTEVIQSEHMPDWINSPSNGKNGQECMSADRFMLPASGISLEDLEKDLILQALEKSSHNKAEAARLLSVSYDTFRYQLKKFGLNG